jgi:hypothetical protein
MMDFKFCSRRKFRQKVAWYSQNGMRNFEL